MIAGALSFLIVAAAVGLFFAFAGGSSSAGSPHHQAAATTASTTTTAAPSTTAPFSPAVIATTKGGSIAVYNDPADASPKTTLSSKTDYGVVRTLLVQQQRPDGWLQVLLPIRPNSSSGWIKTDAVSLASTPYHLEVDLASHDLKFMNARDVVFETKVVIGATATPTPPGHFYITDPVDLRSNPNSDYGVFALGISGFSDVLESFGGGPGQIAVHGTPRPNEVGQSLSHGCVRIPNDMVLQIANTAPLGTPVNIT